MMITIGQVAPMGDRRWPHRSGTSDRPGRHGVTGCFSADQALSEEAVVSPKRASRSSFCPVLRSAELIEILPLPTRSAKPGAANRALQSRLQVPSVRPRRSRNYSGPPVSSPPRASGAADTVEVVRTLITVVTWRSTRRQTRGHTYDGQTPKCIRYEQPSSPWIGASRSPPHGTAVIRQLRDHRHLLPSTAPRGSPPAADNTAFRRPRTRSVAPFQQRPSGCPTTNRLHAASAL